MADECRLDARLVSDGIATGRERSKEYIVAGAVTVNGKTVTKASYKVTAADEVTCAAPSPRYVGRGGLKLEKVLDASSLSLKGVTAMDVGASTGGFTDCMLQRGAAHVYAVDVGHDQLHPTLRQDSRVTVLEGTDVRSEALAAAVAAHSVDFCSVDVSFVSLTNVLPAILPYLTAEATLVCLIKPQFEAGRSALSKRGVVRDKKDHMRVLQRMMMTFQEHHLRPAVLTHSPITGGEGNIEYLAVLKRCEGECLVTVDAAAVVGEAFAALRK